MIYVTINYKLIQFSAYGNQCFCSPNTFKDKFPKRNSLYKYSEGVEDNEDRTET